MGFGILQSRLISHINNRVRNGEISERGLARATEISQPHIHNALKGIRGLSIEMADRIMERLRISVTDLLGPGEGGPGLDSGQAAEYSTVAMLNGWIGPDLPYPTELARQRYPFPASDVRPLVSPLVARLAPDPLRPPLFAGPGLVLLECSVQVRLNPDEEGYFALAMPEGSTIGMLRRTSGGQVCLWSRIFDDVWHSTPLPARDPLDVVQGRVILLVREFEHRGGAI